MATAKPPLPHEGLWHLPGKGDRFEEVSVDGLTLPPLFARGECGAARCLAPARGSGCSCGGQALTALVFRMSSPASLGDRSARLQGHRLWGRGGPAAVTLQRRRPPDLPVSLVWQAPFLPEEAYRLSASSRSHRRKEEDKEGFKKKITKRKTVISNPNLTLQ